MVTISLLCKNVYSLAKGVKASYFEKAIVSNINIFSNKSDWCIKTARGIFTTPNFLWAPQARVLHYTRLELPGTNTLAYWADLEVTRKMKCCEYRPWLTYTLPTKIRLGAGVKIV